MFKPSQTKEEATPVFMLALYVLIPIIVLAVVGILAYCMCIKKIRSNQEHKNVNSASVTPVQFHSKDNSMSNLKGDTTNPQVGIPVQDQMAHYPPVGTAPVMLAPMPIQHAPSATQAGVNFKDENPVISA